MLEILKILDTFYDELVKFSKNNFDELSKSFHKKLFKILKLIFMKSFKNSFKKFNLKSSNSHHLLNHEI
jgi:hypothetical protein